MFGHPQLASSDTIPESSPLAASMLNADSKVGICSKEARDYNNVKCQMSACTYQLLLCPGSSRF